MEAIQTHTVQADAHAAALKKAVKGAKFPSKTAPTINYSDGAGIVQGQECIQTFSTLLSNLKTSINTDADHIKQINWVSNQKNKNTYFYISTDTYITGYAPDVLKDDVFPIKEFPIGTIYSIRSTIDNTRTLYESDENYNLIESRHDYPVTY